MEVGEASEQNSSSAVPEKKAKSSDYGIETRKIQVPKHRMVPLKENWLKIFNPVVEHLKLQIRFNLKTKKVEIRTSKDTQDISNLQKGKKRGTDSLWGGGLPLQKLSSPIMIMYNKLNDFVSAADFVQAFVLGFEVDDALAMLRLDDLFLDSFEITVSGFK